MTGSASLPPPSGEPPRGVIAEFLHLLGSFGRHVQALLALAGVEAREAMGIYVRVAVAVVAALLFLSLAYVLLLFFIAFLLATLFSIHWMWICLGLAVIHLLAMGGCLFFARGHLRSPVFASTSEELRKDFDALKTYQP